MPSRETQSQEPTSKFDGIEDALDIQSDIVPVEKPEVVTPVDTASTKEQLKKDYEYTRGHLYSLVEKGQEAVDGIEDALDIQSDIVPVEKPEVVTSVDTTATKDQLKKDYEYTRGHLYSLVEKGQEAVDGILELAQESDQPRAFEVAGQLIKHVGDVADKLVDLQKKVNEIENPKKDKQVNTTNNTMFVGSTADLAKFLKKQRDK